MEDEKFDKDEITAALETHIETYLNRYQNWDETDLADFSARLPKDITDSLYSKNKNYKYTVVSMLFKKHQVPPKVNSSCLWDAENDIYISICKDTPYYFCLVNIYATYLNS